MDSWNIKDFQFQEYISKGRFGSVWKARCKNTNKIVAIKAVMKDFVIKHKHYQNLRREVEIHYRMSHQHITQFHGYFHDEHFVYMVLEFYPNHNLYYYLKTFHPFPEKDLSKFFIQIVSAVDYMHQRSVIHRDLKLENLFLDENYNIKLGDLGYAVHTIGPRDTYCGTLSYMTREQINQQNYGKEVDIWSLGIILYELVYKYSPFQGANEEETKKHINDYILVFPGEPLIPEPLKNLIKLLLEPNPDKRIKMEQILMNEWIVQQASQYNF